MFFMAMINYWRLLKMPHASNKVEWCLRKAEKEIGELGFHRGLVKVEEDIKLAEKHIIKAEHNLKGAIYFKKGGFSDWSASAFFYCIYHCFLAVLIRFGYESRNQECTIAAIEMLKEKGLDINNKLIDTLKISKAEEMHESSIIRIREDFQYGVEIKFKEKEEFDNFVRLCKEAISKTRDIVHSK